MADQYDDAEIVSRRAYIEPGWFIDEMSLEEIDEAKFIVMSRIENCKVDMASHRQRVQDEGEMYNMVWLARCERFIARQRYLEHMLNQRGAVLRKKEREENNWRNLFCSFVADKFPEDYKRLKQAFDEGAAK